jgi:hypothetical protein
VFTAVRFHQVNERSFAVLTTFVWLDRAQESASA